MIKSQKSIILLFFTLFMQPFCIYTSDSNKPGIKLHFSFNADYENMILLKSVILYCNTIFDSIKSIYPNTIHPIIFECNAIRRDNKTFIAYQKNSYSSKIAATKSSSGGEKNVWEMLLESETDSPSSIELVKRINNQNDITQYQIFIHAPINIDSNYFSSWHAAIMCVQKYFVSKLLPDAKFTLQLHLTSDEQTTYYINENDIKFDKTYLEPGSSQLTEYQKGSLQTGINNKEKIISEIELMGEKDQISQTMRNNSKPKGLSNYLNWKSKNTDQCIIDQQAITKALKEMNSEKYQKSCKFSSLSLHRYK